MRSPVFRVLSIVAMLFVLSAVAVALPEDSVTFRWQPKPEQSIQQEVNAKILLEINTDGPLPKSLPPIPFTLPLKFDITVPVTIRQTTGKADEKGSYTVENKVKLGAFAITMNGAALPVPPMKETDQIPPVTYTVDKDGLITQMAMDGKTADMATAMDLQKFIMGFFPKDPIPVGKSITIPLTRDIPLPIPGATLPPLKLTGDVIIRLLSVSGKGLDKTALVDVMIKAGLSGDFSFSAPNNSGTVAIKFDAKGDGSCQFDMYPERGAMRKADQKFNFEGKVNLKIPAVTEPIPTILIKGNVIATSTGTVQ